MAKQAEMNAPETARKTKPSAAQPPSPPARAAPTGASEPNDESRLLAAISYVLGVFVAVLVFLLKKDDRFVKFHAAQAIMVDLGVMLLSMVAVALGIGLAIALGVLTMGIGFFLGFWVVWAVLMLFGLFVLALRLFLAFQAFTGKEFGIPVIGEQAGKIASG